MELSPTTAIPVNVKWLPYTYTLHRKEKPMTLTLLEYMHLKSLLHPLGLQLYGFLTPVESSKDEVKQMLNGKMDWFSVISWPCDTQRPCFNSMAKV